VAVALDHEGVAVVEEPVEHGGGDHLVAEDVPHWVTIWLLVMSMLPRS
jgi:hypothetical protein